MDEQNVVVEEQNELTFPEDPSSVDELGISDAEFDAAWDEGETVSDSDSEDEAEEADQPETVETNDEDTATEAEETETPAEEVQTEKEDHRFHLKHLDEERDVDEAEVITLAQKGMDYDRIRSERDTLRSERAQFEEYKAFLEELAAPSESTISELMDSTRARLLIASEKKAGRTLTETEALQRVQRERASKAQAAPETTDEPAADVNPNVQDFVKAFPNVKAEEIPQEVWEETRKNGGNLTAAYTQYQSKQDAAKANAVEEENKRLKAEIESLKQNIKNKERSTGSRRTTGKPPAKDAFDALWYNGD